MYRKIIDILLPPVCELCRKPISQPHMLCSACWMEIDWISGPICAVSGIPMPYDLGPQAVCPAVLANPPSYDWARSVGFYSGSLAHLIRRMKFSDQPDICILFAQWLARLMPHPLPPTALIVPVPLHYRRYVGRRYNQSSILARELSHILKRQYVSDLLVRKRPTLPQTSLPRRQRMKNVRGAFMVKPKYANLLHQRTVILVDDVITTSATIESCAHVLRRAHVGEIGIISVARVK